MGFLTGVFKRLGGAVGGVLCGLAALASLSCCGHLIGLADQSGSRWALVFGGFVLWGLLQPRRFLIVVYPVLMLIDVSGSSVGWSGGWRSVLIGGCMLVGAALLAFGWFLQHSALGQAGTIFFWLPFAAQFLSRQPHTAAAS